MNVRKHGPVCLCCRAGCICIKLTAWQFRTTNMASDFEGESQPQRTPSYTSSPSGESSDEVCYLSDGWVSWSSGRADTCTFLGRLWNGMGYVIDLPWTSKTTNASMVIVAPGERTPRMSRTMSSIWRVLLSRYSGTALSSMASSTCCTQMQLNYNECSN